MGIGAWWHWVIVLVIVMVVFGTKKLRNVGSDLGGAVKGFKESMREEEKTPKLDAQAHSEPLEGEVKDKQRS